MSELGAEERYTVKVVFRGLFLAVVGEDSIEVLLPDATAPGQTIKDEKDPRKTLLGCLQPLREHHAAVEFPIADWDNPSHLTPRLVHLDKSTKEPVALYLLEKEVVSFGGLLDDEGALPKPLIAARKLYKRIGKALLLAKHPKHGFDQLPKFESEVDTGAAAKCCAASATINFGEVYTERRSLKDGEPREWRFVSVRSKDYLPPLERERLGLEVPPADIRRKLINLDLVVRFTLAMSNPLQLVCTGPEGGPTPRYFILRPREGRREVTLWIKNRELDAILRDSDLLPDPYTVMEDGDATDRDHGLFMRLAKEPASLRVPRTESADASDSGSGCGGSGKPGG